MQNLSDDLKRQFNEHWRKWEPIIDSYMEKGFIVLPVLAGEKRPIGKWKELALRQLQKDFYINLHFKPAYHFAEAAADQLDSNERHFKVIDPDCVWERTPLQEHRNWGLALVTGKGSGIVVVDWDSPEAYKDWLDSGLPDTPMKTKTPRGYHGFYRIDKDNPVKSHSGLSLNGSNHLFDIRGHKGIIILPPSIHHSGKNYEQVGDWKDVKIEDLPVFDREWIPETKPKIIKTTKPKSDSGFNLERYINRVAPDMQPEYIDGCEGFTGYCPLSSQHQTGKDGPRDFAIWQDESEVIYTKCFHAGCQPWGFAKFRELFPVVKEDFDNQLEEVDLSIIFEPVFVDTDSGEEVPDPAEDDSLLDIKCFTEIQDKKLSWLWEQTFVDGSLNLLVGDPGCGKSTITVDIAARVTAGLQFPDNPEKKFRQGKVLFLGAEDDVAATIKQRFITAGGDLNNFYYLNSVNKDNEAFNFAKDLKRIRSWFRHHPDFRLLIVDPLSAYLGETDNIGANIRSVLTPLMQVIQEEEIAVLGIMHTNKNPNAHSVMDRVLGSREYSALPRMIWGLSKDKECPENKMMVNLKSNLTIDHQGLAYSIQKQTLDPDLCDTFVSWNNLRVTVDPKDIMCGNFNGVISSMTDNFEQPDLGTINTEISAIEFDHEIDLGGSDEAI